MYIYLYTGPQLRLRKARFERVTVPVDFSVSVSRGEFEGGGTEAHAMYTPLALAAQRQKSLIFSVCF